MANGGGLSLYEIAGSGFDGSQIDWGGLTEIQPVTTPNGLNLIDFGEQACRLPSVGDPTEQPAQECGRTVIVWNADAVAMVIAGPSTVDALAFAQGIKPA